MDKIFIKEKKLVEHLAGYFFMFLGCVAYGASTSLFLEPNGIVAGGVTGLAVLINMVFSDVLETGTWFILINIPILILGVKTQGWKFIFRCLLTVVVLGVVTDVIDLINNSVNGTSVSLTDDKVLASLYGGICQGIGIGLFVRFQFSSGGTELLARLIAGVVKLINIPVCLGIIDGLIVVLGAFKSGIENILYALIVVFVSAKLSEVILVGLDKSKLCIIITDKGEEISSTLLKNSPRGVTMLNGQGMYLHKERYVLLTCVKHTQIYQVKNLVSSVDPNAFVIINDAVEVRGKGFQSIIDDDKKRKLNKN